MDGESKQPSVGTKSTARRKTLNDFFYMWLKEQPGKGEMIEKKTFKVYSWTFNAIEGPSENDSRSR
ncbi:MAG: hypothetical protein IKW49_08565 [Opitutales bacterium]|nr:hypothetical protein [Opitutales bacterium]